MHSASNDRFRSEADPRPSSAAGRLIDASPRLGVRGAIADSALFKALTICLAPSLPATPRRSRPESDTAKVAKTAAERRHSGMHPTYDNGS